MDERALRWNLVANTMDGALFSLGLSFVSFQTILPIFVHNIGGGNIAIGLIPVVWVFGFNFPQVMIAGVAERYPRKKQLFLRTAAVQRLPWLLLALYAFFLVGNVSETLALWVFFAGFALAAVGGSVNLPVWFDLITKITPVTVRGRLFGTRSILGSSLGVLGGAAAAVVLGVLAFPESFAVLFLLTFAAMLLSYAFLVTLKVPETPAGAAPAAQPHLLYRVPGILRAEKNFRRFLVADALLIGASMGNAFFTVHAFQRFSLADTYAGAFTVAVMAGSIAGGALFGVLADRMGHRINLLISACSGLAACLLALIATSVEVYFAVFFFLSWTTTAAMISRLPLIAELCAESERPTYVAVTNMLTSPFVPSGVLAGWMANNFGYEVVFVTAGALSLAAIFWILKKFREPRTAHLQPSAEDQ